MRKISIIVCVLLLANIANAQSFGDFVNKAKKTINSSSNSGGSYTNTEAVNALREALKIGTQNASGRLSALNGYFGNQVIKILMPPEAKKVENTLRSMGMGAQVDKA